MNRLNTLPVHVIRMFTVRPCKLVCDLKAAQKASPGLGAFAVKEISNERRRSLKDAVQAILCICSRPFLVTGA